MVTSIKRLKIIGIYQIVGGLIGLVTTSYLLANYGISDIAIFKIVILFLALYFFSIFCGYLILKEQYEKGLNYSILNQLLQVLSFTILGFAFKFYAGAYLCIGLNLTTDTILTYNIGVSAWNFEINSDTRTTNLSINVVALVLINIIFNLKDKIHLEEIIIKN